MREKGTATLRLYFVEHYGDIASVAGLVISVVGFVVTIIGVEKHARQLKRRGKLRDSRSHESAQG